MGEGDARGHQLRARTIADDRLVGGIGLMDINRRWGAARPVDLPTGRLGSGYGREMIVLALRYAFNELNLHRVAHDERQRARLKL